MKIYSLFILLLLVQQMNAQKDDKRRFTATLVAGVNISQIDGDAAWGYSKAGLNAGVRGGIIFSENVELCTEILFSQKGAANIPKNSQNFSNYTIHLDYIEVPVLIYYKDWEVTNANNEKYMRVMFGGGFSYSRLLNTQLTGTLSHPMGKIDAYTQNDFMFIIDANIFVTKNLGFNLRWARSITTIYNSQPEGARPDYSINRSIVLRALYRF